MTKEHFELAAEGAGFIQNKYNGDIWEHPNAEVEIWYINETTMRITAGPVDPSHYFRPLTLQRITHLFKAFQL